jgi:ribose transport system permease protein
MSASLSHDGGTRGPARKNGPRRLVQRNGWVLGIVGLLLVLLGVERAVHPTLNAFDLQSLMDGALPLALAAMGQAAVVLSGGIDLSVGPMMGLVNVVSAMLMAHADFPAALVIGLLLLVAAALAGGLTGIVITATGVPDIVATLASGFVWAGLALHLMPIPGGGAPPTFAGLMTGQFGPGMPAGLVVVLAALAVWLPLRRSRLGLAMYAVGSSRPAAYLSGVNVTRARIAAYVLGGGFTALGGLAPTASTSSGNAASGTSYTLTSVAAVVLGGVSLTGGRGGMLGPLAAALILTLINTMLTFLGVDPNFSLVIQGAIVVLVVMAAGLVLARRRL